MSELRERQQSAIGAGHRDPGHLARVNVMTQQWYIRRADRTKGPFPWERVARALAAGQLAPGDELSTDRRVWQPVAVVQARVAAEGGAAPPLRVHTERPIPSGRALRRQLEQIERSRRPSRRYAQLVALTLGLCAIAVVGIYLAPPPDEGGPQCQAQPAPGVDWRGCRLGARSLARVNLNAADLSNARLGGSRLVGASLRGAKLSYSELAGADLSYSDAREAQLVGADLGAADLSYANLEGANLAYANLRDANIGGASLTDARLDRTVWVDGRVCAVGSRGVCR